MPCELEDRGFKLTFAMVVTPAWTLENMLVTLLIFVLVFFQFLSILFSSFQFSFAKSF